MQSAAFSQLVVRPLPRLRARIQERVALRTATAYVAGLALPLLPFALTQKIRLDQPGVAYMAAVLAASAIGAAGGVTAVLWGAVFLKIGGRSGGDDLGDTLVFVVIASAIPLLAARSRRDAVALRRSEHLYRELVEELPLVTYVEDASQPGKTIYISPQVEDLLGYPAEQWLEDDRLFFDVLHPDNRDEILAARARGDVRTTQEFRLIAADRSERWIHSERTTVTDVDGEPLYVQGLWIDLTERRELEVRLRQQDRLDTVGQLAAGIAHDFNNMLLAIRGYAELAAGRSNLDEARRDLSVILRTADRSAELVRRLLAFSRRQTLQPRSTDIRHVLDELLELLRRLVGAGVEVVFDAPERPVIAFVDQAQIEQVIVNLAVNARDAMNGEGTLTVVLREVEPATDAGDAGVVISVTDTGSGIEPDVAVRVFEPFFTTKDDRGSGLGLATAHGVVHQSGGEIRLAHTERGGGTTFEIFLPSQPTRHA